MRPSAVSPLDPDTFASIREVAPPDAPLTATLARSPDGTTVLLVDEALLEDWPAWALSGADHVWAPLDVARRDDGHDIVLPALSVRADRLLSRRDAAGLGLTDGERITLVVSVLRGTVAALDGGVPAPTSAAWWLTAEGEPQLAAAAGESTDLAGAALAVLELAVTGSPAPELERAIDALRTALRDPRTLSRRADDLEDALFAAAAAAGATAEPIVVQVLGPTPSVRAVAAAQSADAQSADARDTRSRSRGGWWQPLARAGDLALADTAIRAIERVRARLAHARRMPAALVGVLVAALVIAVGIGWPEGDAPAAETSAAPVQTPRAGDASTGAGTDPAAAVATTPVEASEPDEPLAALERLLAVRRACPDAGCWPATQEDPAETLDGGALDAPAPRVTLLEDFGGLAVLRVDAEGAVSRLVTVVTTPSGWRLRDVFDAAEPAG